MEWASGWMVVLLVPNHLKETDILCYAGHRKRNRHSQTSQIELEKE